MGNRWWAVLWLGLLPLRGAAAASPNAGVGTDEGFVQVEPTLILDGGAEFGLHLGAPVRLRLWGGGESTGFVRPGAFASVGLGVDHAR